MKTEAGVRQFAAIASDSADLVLEFGGALSGEHGDGLVRSGFMERMFGPALYEAFRHIKRTFDPGGIFNPGKIVDAPPLTANLRYGPAYRAVQPLTFFDYSDHGGLAGAVEMCSGLGACRKVLDGTMCPSYMATREESHSTRGRANVLRLAMSGRLGEAGLGDEGVRQVLDLCLECRACKAECPVGVDVARFKSEFLADYWRRHGTPHPCAHARTRPRRVALGQPLRAAVECDRAERAGALAERAAARHGSPARTAGLDGRRPSRRVLQRHRRQRRAAMRHDAVSGTVAFFNDTFTNYYSPGIGMAGVQVLERAGFDVELAPLACCGRPLISQGLLAAARRQAESSVERLYPLAERGLPIVFFEPSCLSAIREDVPSLLRGERAAPRPARGRSRGALRRVPGERMPGGTRAARSGPGAVADCSCTGTVIRRPWAAWRRQRRCSAGYPAQRWSISMPAAAAWPDPSAMRANTSRCRVPSESGGCCRPRGASVMVRSWSLAGPRAGIRSPTSPASGRCIRRS